MELRYAFDPAKWRLGKLCPHGHEWPGTGQSLRRAEPGVYGCAGCTGRKQSDWLVSFIDHRSMGLPAGHKLSKLCSNGHQWNRLDLTLRINGRCRDCDEAVRPAKQQRAKSKRAHDPELRKTLNWRAKQREKERVESDVAYAERRRIYRRDRKRMIAIELRSKGLTTYGTAPTRLDAAVPKGERNEAIALQRALQQACQSPTIPQLLAQAQRLYWRENPGSKPCDPHEIERRKERARVLWRVRYQNDLDLRLYHREKKHRRKAKERGQTPLQVPVAALRNRFDEFGNCCAYCGQVGDMQIEHVEPISEGGLHDIGNIVPACLPCNYSKRTSRMESWYRRQPFFSELRLQAIRRVTRQPEGAQLALALA